MLKQCTKMPVANPAKIESVLFMMMRRYKLDLEPIHCNQPLMLINTSLITSYWIQPRSGRPLDGGG